MLKGMTQKMIESTQELNSHCFLFVRCLVTVCFAFTQYPRHHSLNQTLLQLDREGIKERHGEKVGGGGNYSREVVNRGTTVIQGNTVGMKNKPLAQRVGHDMVKIFVPGNIVSCKLFYLNTTESNSAHC